MNTTVKIELTEYINDNIDNYKKNDPDLHHHLFNEDYYIIGYYNADQWLKNHNISVFEALNTIRDYEEFNFGETRSYDNAEETVNMLVYIYGEQLLAELELI
tara:strand:+ start:229 stop:534 length:306 start_codon:yes stop_codon:yes gene_type:complete